MKLGDFFKKLSYSYLSELAIGGSGSGQIPDSEKPKVLMRINEALIMLYTRFPLRMKILTLQTYAAVNEYVLSQENMVGAIPAPTYPYIISSFTGDILMLDSITDAEGNVIPVNDENEEESWHVVANDPYPVLNVVEPEDGATFVVRYRAMPPEVTLGPAVDKDTLIPVPRHLETALLCYVAGLVYGNMSIEGGLAKSQNFLDMAENEMKIVEERNTLNTSPAFTNQKMKLNGWP